jgi:hypothetical protein
MVQELPFGEEIIINKNILDKVFYFCKLILRNENGYIKDEKISDLKK